MATNAANEKFNFNKAIFPGIQGGPLEHVPDNVVRLAERDALLCEMLRDIRRIQEALAELIRDLVQTELCLLYHLREDHEGILPRIDRVEHERVRIGQASPDEALSLQAQAEQTRAELPALRKQLQQTEHLLAVLAGRAPGTGGIPAFTLADFTLPVEMPLVVPSELVRRRPDIQASEALLHG